MTDTIEAIEHPIIFNDWSIRRILASEKTQTRRIVKPQPDLKGVTDTDLKLRQDPVSKEWVVAPIGDLVPSMEAAHGWVNENFPKYPYGQPGDVLWVREAFRLPVVNDNVSPRDYIDVGCDVWRYEADGEVHDPGDWCDLSGFDGWGRKRPSIHMPRELCRLRLRVEDVRVERVQEISGYDAIAEGVQPPRPEVENGARTVHDVARDLFREKWNEIHGDGAWERNDWVWVVEFDRIE